MSYSSADLGAYILPGRVESPVPGIAEAIAAEKFGLGTVWLSERAETKEMGAVCGALTQVTSNIGIGVGVTHFQTRHPIILAGLGMTMQALSGERFILGFGRSGGSTWGAMGLPKSTLASMRDYAKILQGLWAGEEVNYDGPAGRYPSLQLPNIVASAPPIVLAAIGPKTLALAGTDFDGVILHPFLTLSGVQRSVEIVHHAAEEAGRDPAAVKIYACVVVAPDLPPEEEQKVVRGRAVTYFGHRDIGSQLINMNGWDTAPMEQVLAHPLLTSAKAEVSRAYTREQLIGVGELLPEEWIATGAAVGTTAYCAERLRDYRRAGADEILLHGTTPDRVGGLVGAYCDDA